LVLALTYPGLHEALIAANYRPLAWPKSEADWRRAVELAPEIEAVVTIGIEPLTEAFMAAATKLRIICCLGAGYDSYDPIALARRGIKVTNASGINADGWVRQGQWPARTIYSRRIRGNRLGIVGLGAIGRAVALRGEAFGMTVGWHGPHPKQVAWPYFADLVELARWSDVLCICCRPTAENEGLIDASVLDALGPKGILVNVARGSLVDEPALISALREGRIAAAALDVFTEEPTDPRQWSGVPNVTLHPHRAGSTVEAIQEAVELTIENLRRLYAGEPLRNQVS
jgi:phosphoglycerate dehydrogenase-like enzyme